MSKKETTVMLKAEIILVGDDDGEIAEKVTNEQIAEIIKRRLDADHVIVTSKKIFTKEEAADGLNE